MSGIEIRRLGLDDIEAVHDIEKRCFSCPWSRRSLEASVSHPASYWSGAWIGGMLAGFLGAFSAAGEAEILDIAVDPERRRQGVGRLLMRSALGSFAEEGVTDVFLDVRRSNRPAIELYSSLGFEVFTVRAGYYSQPPEDAYGMRLTLRKTNGNDIN